MWFLVLIIFVFVLVIYFKIKKAYRYWEHRQVNFIKPWPVLGNLGEFLCGRVTLVENMQKIYYSYPNERYIGIYQFLKPTLCVRDTELLKKITIKDFDHFINRRALASEDVDPLFGKNLFSLRDQKWKDMRNTLSPAFSGSKIRFMYTLIEEISEQFSDYLSKSVTSEEPVTFELKDLFTRVTNDIIATTAFGIKCNSLSVKDNSFFKMGTQMLFEGFLDNLKLFSYSLSPSLMKMLRVKIFSNKLGAFFTDFVVSSMKIRQEKGISRPDMIQILMEAKNKQLIPSDGKEEKHKSQIEWTDDLITAQALIFYFAGFETVSILFCHMATELAVNPEVQEKLQQEIDEAIENCNGEVNYDVIMGTKYMEMVINETLRKWPPAPLIERECVKPYFIHDPQNPENSLYLSKGQLIWIPVYAIQRDPDYFEDPDRFDPERFSTENKDRIKTSSFFPFGLGPRVCIEYRINLPKFHLSSNTGARLAILETKMIFFKLLSKFTLTVVKETHVPMKLKRLQFNLNAEKGFYVGLKRRK